MYEICQSRLTFTQNICIMNCNRPYEIFAMSSPQFITKKKYSVTLDFDVYEDFNPYEIQVEKIIPNRRARKVRCKYKNLDIDIDDRKNIDL